MRSKTQFQPGVYREIIMGATGCSMVQAAKIEEVMRDDIFHSTLDWQTREQLEQAAREAAKMLGIDLGNKPDQRL